MPDLPTPSPAFPSRQLRRATLLVLTAAAMWGMLGPGVRWALATGLQPMEIAFFRSLFAMLGFGTQAIFTRNRSLPVRVLPWVLLQGSIGLAGLQLLFMTAIDQLGVALASALMYTAPAWVVALCWRRLSAHARRPSLVAVLATVTGVAVISLPNGISTVTIGAGALGIGLLSGVAYALFSLLGQRCIQHAAIAPVYTVGNLVAVVVLLPFVELYGITEKGWAALLVLGLLFTWLPNYLYFLGLRTLGSVRASLLALLDPVVAFAMAVVLWGEQPTNQAVFGVGLIITGAIVATRTTHNTAGG